MKRHGELFHRLHPRHTIRRWTVFYIVLGVGLLAGLSVAANHINTRSVATGSVALSTPYSQYLQGEAVSVALTNRYNAPVFVTNQCPAEPVAVYYHEATKWVRVRDTSTHRDCSTMQRQVAIPATSTVVLSLAPWQSLFSNAGTYRLVADVDGSSNLPYVDFSIVAPAPPVAASPAATSHAIATNTAAHAATVTHPAQTTTGGTSTSPTAPSALVTTPTSNTPTPKPAPKTIQLHVTAAGNYDTTSISLNVGDSINFIYSPPYQGEVRTHFSVISPITATLSSITVDSEFKSRTKTFTTAGSWRFKADDHNGNSGQITVN